MHSLQVIHRLNKEATEAAAAATSQTSKALADVIAARKAELATRETAKASAE